MNGLIEGVAANTISTAFRWLIFGVMGRRIRITHPREGETLMDPERCVPGGLCFQVRGTLKSLAENHEIWLLLADDAGRIWPQGFFAVHYDPYLKSWMGKINGAGRTYVKIIAVVAPPTSQDFFHYYQEQGRSTNFQPLNRLPAECLNAASVRARIV